MGIEPVAMGQVAAGIIQVGDSEVRLEVTLPWLLHGFAQMVVGAIENRARVLLAKKTPYLRRRLAARG